MNAIEGVEGMRKHAPTRGAGGMLPQKMFKNYCSEIESGAFSRYFYTYQNTTSTEILDEENIIILFYGNPGSRGYVTLE